MANSAEFDDELCTEDFSLRTEELCTICLLIIEDTDSTQSIFSTLEEFESPLTVLQVLRSFSNFNFYNTQLYTVHNTQLVCTTCYSKTIEVYKFIQMCNKAHDNMQQYLEREEEMRRRNDSNYEEVDDMAVDPEIEEIDISPTRMESEKTAISDEIIISSGEEETNNYEEISHPQTRIEEITDSSNFDNPSVDLVFSDKKELADDRKEAKHISEMRKASFGTKYNLRRHGQRHNVQRARISKDLRLNPTKENRHQPLRDHEPDVVCPECQDVFNNDKQLKVHLRKSHKKTFLCNDCGKGFTTKSLLNTHIRGHAGDSHNEVKAHKCQQCDRRFTLALDLRRHMDIHNGIKAHKCEQCDRRFSRASVLLSHMNLHTGVKPHKCEQCDRRFTQAAHLRTHMAVHNGIKAHKCEQCDRRFTQASNLRRHMNMHNGIKAHKCEQCDRRFIQASDLRRHMDIHNGIKAHKCEQCDRRFTRAAHLLSHMNIHTGVKPHKCQQCNRRFTHASNLRTHMAVHNGIKAHKCEQCDRRFSLAAYLRRHMKIHNRELSHKCDKCDKRFALRRTQLAHQLAHQRIHTANTCTICDKACGTSSALKIHLRSHNIVNTNGFGSC